MDIPSSIFSRAKDLFMRCGVKSVTMDDLASDMGMSKRTLYQMIPSKEKLIERIVNNHIKEEKRAIEEIRKKAENAVVEFIMIAEFGLQMLRQVSPNMVYEIKKYYHQSWNKLEKLNNEHMYTCLEENLKDGIKQGYYRKDLNTEIISKFYIMLCNSLIDQNIFPQSLMSLEKLFIEAIQYHLKSITTPAGWELCQKQISKTIKV